MSKNLSKDKEIHFCGECYNLTYLATNEDQELVHYCKICEKVEKFSGNNCIYSIGFTNLDVSQVINSNKYITHDKTIPSIKNNINLVCPKESCQTNTEGIEKSFKYIKYDEKDMKYIYICNTCGQKWTN